MQYQLILTVEHSLHFYPYFTSIHHYPVVYMLLFLIAPANSEWPKYLDLFPDIIWAWQWAVLEAFVSFIVLSQFLPLVDNNFLQVFQLAKIVVATLAFLLLVLEYLLIHVMVLKFIAIFQFLMLLIIVTVILYDLTLSIEKVNS